MFLDCWTWISWGNRQKSYCESDSFA